MAEESQKPAQRRRPAATDGVEHVERRRQPRDLESPPSWEAIVLQRMAGRVKSLSGELTHGSVADSDGGWEEAALLALRRRIQGPHSK